MDVFREAFDNKPFDQLTTHDFGTVFRKAFATMDPHPNNRTFAEADSKFSDDAIANLLFDATESPAGAYRARGTPGVLGIVEILGILQ
ncbi:hypothetical protein R3P38DRAFT_3210470 [Favolaschia claudopus]|uniref:Uncharacterized protein n=1 Tax=Favolaschia claudopus TaxID=2862362 RepID=A0AAW0AG84_9AGAR